MTKPLSLADPEQLQQLYQQACDELDQLEPDLRQLEVDLAAMQQRYQTLKQNKQRLLTIKLSLHHLVKPDDHAEAAETLPMDIKPVMPTTAVTHNDDFSADVAFHEINQRLRQRDSVNYEIFRAIVYQGGRANTEQVKQYLIEQNIRQPANGDDFKQVTLADISARVNYLVKKGLVTIEQRGQFKSVYGWVNLQGAHK